MVACGGRCQRPLFFLDFFVFVDVVPESVVAVAESSAGASFFVFFLDFLVVVVVESSGVVCACKRRRHSHRGEQTERYGPQAQFQFHVVHEVSLVGGVLGPFLLMRRGSDSSGRSMGMRVEAAIMPVRRPKVNIGRYSNGLFVTCDRAFRACSTQTQLGGTQLAASRRETDLSYHEGF